MKCLTSMWVYSMVIMKSQQSMLIKPTRIRAEAETSVFMNINSQIASKSFISLWTRLKFCLYLHLLKCNYSSSLHYCIQHIRGVSIVTLFTGRRVTGRYSHYTNFAKLHLFTISTFAAYWYNTSSGSLLFFF